MSDLINLADILSAVPEKPSRARAEKNPAISISAPVSRPEALLTFLGLNTMIAGRVFQVLHAQESAVNLRAGNAKGVGNQKKLCVAVEIDAPTNKEPVLESAVIGTTKYALTMNGRGDDKSKATGTQCAIPSVASLVLSLLRATATLHNVRKALLAIDKGRVNEVDDLESYDAVIICPNTGNPADVASAVALALRPQRDALMISLLDSLYKAMNIEADLPISEGVPVTEVRRIMKPLATEEAPTEDAPTEEAPVETAPAEEAPVKKARAKKSRAKKDDVTAEA